jgi:hypothetical protein
MRWLRNCKVQIENCSLKTEMRHPAPSSRHRSSSLKLAICTLQFVVALMLTGCVTPTATTQPVTQVDPRQADPAYWLSQDDAATIRSRNFDALWSAAQEAARDHHFRIDRTDFRSGLITTAPLVSKQFFELWRNEVRDIDHLAESSLGTVRRTLHLDIERLDDGSYQLVPRAVIERQVYASRRLGSSISYQKVIGTGGIGTPESDQGILLPTFYWYAIGRDATLERSIARNIEKRLASRK